MIVGFSGFGFPKAHGAAFGLLAYQSTWLRVHYGPEFLCALLNEQPMGFYAPDTLVHEAQRRGIECCRPTSTRARCGCTRRPPEGAVAARPGRTSLGVRDDEVAALVAAREEGGPFRSLGDLASRAGAGRPSLDRLAWAGACDSPGRRGAGHRRRARRDAALWQLGVARAGRGRAGGEGHAARAAARAARTRRSCGRWTPWEAMIADYATTGLTLGPHPMELLRAALPRRARCRARDLERLPHGARVRLGGLVVARQRPGTAKGIVFLLLEDEFGTINLIVPPPSTSATA